MANEDHEKLMSPSAWNKRFNPTDVIINFRKLGEEATLQARKNTCCEIDIPYGTSNCTKYDVYGTDLPDDAPIFVYIHGGYWQVMSKDMSAFAAEVCVSEGIKVICVGYDLCPDVQLRDIVCQIKTVVKKILHDAGRSGSRGVWIGGHSAGAHLSASLLDTEWLQNEPNSSLLKGLVLLSGIYFLEPLITTSYNDALKLDSNEAMLLSTLSVELEAPVKNLKALIVVGEYDSPEFIDQARGLMKKLCSSVDEVEYILLRDIDHFNMMENCANKDFPLIKRIIKYINDPQA